MEKDNFGLICNANNLHNEKKSEYPSVGFEQSKTSITREYRGYFIYFSMAIIWGIIVYYLGNNFSVNRFWIVPLSVFVLGVPIAVCGFYNGTVEQIKTASGFKKQGKIHRFITAKPLMMVLIVCWAIFSSFFMLIQFHTYSTLEWVSFFMVIPVFCLVFYICKRQISKELRPYLVTTWALASARRLTAILMLLTYIIFIKIFGNIPEYNSIQDAVNAEKASVADMTGSAMVYEVSHYLAIYNGFKAYTISNIGGIDEMWPLLFFALGGVVVYYNACSMLSCFLIPRAEYHRIFNNPTDTDEPQPVIKSKIFTFSLIFTFIVMFIYIPLFAKVEAWFQQRPMIGESRQVVESIVVKSFEKIDDTLFKEGTIAQIETAKLEALRRVNASVVEFDTQVDIAFTRMEMNVDGYLDWYYSLVGEYSRLGAVMVGELEQYMEDQFEKYLLEGNVFNGVKDSIEKAVANQKNAKEEYERIVKGIMQDNQVTPTDNSYKVVNQTSLNKLISLTIHSDFIKIEQRFSTGAVAGGVAGVLAGKALAKTASKGTFKLAAKAMAKVITSKAAGSAAGASVGAVIGGILGSAVPGVGTAAGAAVGGSIGGVVVGVSVDKLMLELEEQLSRDEFKTKILSAIAETREEFKKENAELDPVLKPDWPAPTISVSNQLHGRNNRR